MSQQHLETIRTGQKSFSQGDLSWAREFVAEDVEWHPTGSFPGLEGVYRGPDALDRWMQAIRAEWEEFEATLGEVLRDEGDDLVVAEHLRGRGRESGAEVEMRIYSVYRFNADGKIRQRLAFTTAEEALAALDRSRSQE